MSDSAEIVPGDDFAFKPGEAHQLIAGADGLVIYVVADNPIGDECTLHEALATRSTAAPV